MAEVSETFHERWASGEHVGEAGPVTFGFIRTGEFRRGYDPWPAPWDIHIPGSSPQNPYQATWHPLTDYVDLPNVRSVNFTQDFEQKGITVATVVIDNIMLVEKTGVGGSIYHLIERGWLSPFRGYRAPNRPDAGVQQNEWFEKLNRNAQIFLVQGYGDASVSTFTGLIDEIDLDSSPDTITMTVRDFGQTLTDQRLFGTVKDPHITDPVTFADKKNMDKTEKVGGGAKASSEFPGHPARFVTTTDKKAAWWSENRGSKYPTEWIQIRVPKGRYESLYLELDYPGMEVFVGVFGRGNDGNYSVDGVQYDNGWYRGPNGDFPEVPGEHGGWPYFKHYPELPKGPKTIPIGTFMSGDDSVFRIGFRNLYDRTDYEDAAGRPRPNVVPKFRAAVSRFAAVKRVQVPEAKKGNYILINDVSDIVRVILRWAGFKEMEIENTGVKLGSGVAGDEATGKNKKGDSKSAKPSPGTGKVTFNRSNFLIDIISQICEKTGFIFYIKEPTSPFNNSIGVPVFRSNRVLANNPDIRELRDDQILTGVQAKVTEEPLSYIIRVRGRTASEKEGGQKLGGSEEGKTLRLMASYRPPWTREGRLAGIIKHRTVNRFDLKTEDECKFACFLVALYESLESITAVVEVPGTPEFELDDQVSIIDEATGLNTRMWIARRTSEFTYSKSGNVWKTTLSGALIDTPDIQDIAADVWTFFAELATRKAPEEKAPKVSGGKKQPTQKGPKKKKLPKRRH